jgi:N,N'-diacetylchitobiose transport system permease protein
VSNAPPAAAAVAAGPPARRRRSRSLRVRLGRGVTPYLLLAPATVTIAAVLAYPLYYLGKLSFQKYGLPELIAHQGTWIGTDNFTRLFHDEEFWHVLVRTFVFTGFAVSLTMLFGTLIALLLARLGAFMRLFLTTGLVLVWAMPVVVAVNIWVWMFDYEFGVFNWALTKLGVGNYINHDWFESPRTGFAIIIGVVVWGAIPFVAITIYAGLTQVPKELVEAASIDGAGSTRVFRDITFPLLKPIFVILASLSIIWDFQVFNQVWIMRGNNPSSDYYLMAVYAYVQSFKLSEYGFGAAIAVVMVAIMFSVTFVYIRQMVRIGEVR